MHSLAHDVRGFIALFFGLLGFEVTGTETVVDDKVNGTVHLRAGPHPIVKSELEQSTPRGTQTITQILSKMSTPTSTSSTR